MIPNYLDKYIYSQNDILTFNRSVYDESGKLWVYSNRMSACFCIDLDNFTSIFIGWNEKCERIGYGADVVGIYNKYLINITRDARYVERIDTNSFAKEYVFLEYAGEKKDDKYVSIIMDDKLLLVSVDSNEVYNFDLREICSQSVVQGKRFVHKKKNEIVKIENIFCIGQYLVILSAGVPCLEVIDSHDFSSVIYRIDDVGKEIVDIVFCGSKVYILFIEGHVAIFDKENSKLKDIIINRIESKAEDKKYRKLFVIGENIWVFPATKDDILIGNIVSKKIKIYENYPKDFQYQFPNYHAKYACFSENEEYIYIGQRNANYMMIIDKKTQKEKWTQINLPEYFIHGIFTKDIIREAEKKVFNETVICLSDYLQAIK